MSRRRRRAAALAAALAGGLGWGGPVHAGSVSVDAARGRLTVAVDGAPLEAVLDAVGAETGVAVTIYGPIARDVSDRFRGLSVEAGLRRLLRAFNVAFVYGPSHGPAPARLERVVVYPASEPSGASDRPGGGRPAAAGPPAAAVPAVGSPPAPRPGPEPAAPGGPAPPGEQAGAGEPAVPGEPAGPEPPAAVAASGSAAANEEPAAPAAGAAAAERTGADREAAALEIGRLLEDGDPRVRRQALEAAEATGLASPEALREAALRDPDLQVRWAALAALVATAGREAAVDAAESALGSAAAPERLAALEALGEQLGGEAGERAARRALADPDPVVRAKAAEIVAILEEDQRLADGNGEPVEGDDAEAPEGAAPR